ncbi:hypothetical protein TRFO_17937 [Tritrichomonas foetus]|uniref:Uncharacterized protein n=1 Tax=Tritrichomonas foetus TaxID=1144522 RepID=A0A1J4KLT8_9EUKA|nr:hypothetical protein TRFO_17937 [Tritrichomonas foetus]|eukprot:OHT12265.1 hypothetical protein TRFO_17937 [Tritrichomonas foetus]
MDIPYKADLDVIHFNFYETELRRNTIYNHDESEKIITETLSLIYQISDIVSYSEDFIKLCNTLCDACFSFTGSLTNIIPKECVTFFFQLIHTENQYELNNVIINLLFVFTKDLQIKQYLFSLGVINMMFHLFEIDKSYFVLACNILGIYMIESPTEIQEFIMNFKFQNKPKRFFKYLLFYVNNLSLENQLFAHSALFLLSQVIVYFKISNEQLSLITNAIINRFCVIQNETDINDCVYVFYCLIKIYPENMLLFSQTKVLLALASFLKMNFSEPIFINLLILLQNILSVDGVHITYFMPLFDLFSFLVSTLGKPSNLDHTSNLDDTSHLINSSYSVIKTTLKVLHFAIIHIPTLADFLVISKVNFLELLANLYENCTFNQKKYVMIVISDLLIKSGIEIAITVLKSDIFSILISSVEQFSEEYSHVLFNGMFNLLGRMNENQISQIDVLLKITIENLSNAQSPYIQKMSQIIQESLDISLDK